MPELSSLGGPVKETYEGEANTNAFTDAEKLKLAGLTNTTSTWSNIEGKPAVIGAGETQAAARTAIGAMAESSRAVANGVAPLDASGMIPPEFLNVSGLQFKGAWNAETNTPVLINGEGSVGDFYKVGTPGTYNFGNGSYTFLTGDWVMFAAGVWQRLGSSDAVSTVNGMLGNVVLTADDVGALPNTYAPTYAALPDKPTIPAAYVPPQLTYANRMANRAVNTWYTNPSIYDRVVNVVGSYGAGAASSRIEMRAAGTTTPTFLALSQATAASVDVNHIMQAIVPAGWQYRYVPASSGRSISAWFEGDYA